MPILEVNYTPPIWLRNAHINTLFPYLFRKSNIVYSRQRVFTPDQDFFDVDNVHDKQKKLAVLLHGLEGSAYSQYMLGTSELLAQHGWDVSCINFRSCSGPINLQKSLYHSGFTADLHHYIQNHTIDYETVVLIGFSLGGNVVLKYTTDQVYVVPHNIRCAIGVSVPCDLKGSSIEIKKRKNIIYQRNFLKSLSNKMRQKATQFPEIQIENMSKVKNLVDFDDYFTAPIHGFRDADDYYFQNSSLKSLPNAVIPTLLINAKDDTFLSPSCFPINMAQGHKNFYLSMPSYGGHVGFANFGAPFNWNELTILKFISDHVES